MAFWFSIGQKIMRHSNTQYWALLVLLAVTLSPILGYSAEQNWRRPEKLKILPYPSEDEVDKSFFSSDGFRVSPLQTDDINQGFSNIDDLSWLQPLVKECRVVLVGETHYNQYIHHLRNRLLFALNTFDRYPSVMLERPYSLTPFMNYYAALPDKEAREFEQANRELFLFTADVQFLQHVRRWNATYPKKRIQVGCYDIEHRYQHQNRPLVFHHVPWASLGEQATQMSPEHAQAVVAIQEGWQLHDLKILVPISPLTALRKRGESATADPHVPSNTP
jgi:hypothetical protein